jgi:hypothetical protein
MKGLGADTYHRLKELPERLELRIKSESGEAKLSSNMSSRKPESLLDAPQ